MSERSRFVDELHALDARETRARLAEAIAAVKAHPGYVDGPRSRVLHDALSAVERELLAAARAAVVRLDAAVREADRPHMVRVVPGADPGMPLPEFLIQGLSEQHQG